MISETLFGKACMQLGVDWNMNQMSRFFNEVDRAFNKNQTKLAITPEQIDQTVHFSTARSIDDLQVDIVNHIAQHIS